MAEKESDFGVDSPDSVVPEKASIDLEPLRIQALRELGKTAVESKAE